MEKVFPMYFLYLFCHLLLCQRKKTKTILMNLLMNIKIVLTEKTIEIHFNLSSIDLCLYDLNMEFYCAQF